MSTIRNQFSNFWFNFFLISKTQKTFIFTILVRCGWLTKPFFSFWSLNRCAKFQSNLIVPSRVVVSKDTGQRNRHFREIHFFWSRGSQNHFTSAGLRGDVHVKISKKRFFFSIIWKYSMLSVYWPEQKNHWISQSYG